MKEKLSSVLTRKVLLQQAGKIYFTRGEKQYRAGNVKKLILSDNTLIATVPEDSAALPELLEMTPLVTDFTPGNNDLYELSVPTLNGKMIYDYLSIPKAPGKYPIIVGYPGTGAAAGIRPQFIRCDQFVYGSSYLPRHSQ